MGKCVSETAERRIKLQAQELKRSAPALERRAHSEWGNSGQALGGVVKNFLGALRGLAETCVEMRKLDRSRALRISKADSDEWKRFAMTTLREALDYLVARLPVVADKFGASPQAATQAQQLLGERYIAIEDFMNIELDDQHVEGRIAVRDKAIRWGTNGFFAVGGYLLHALGPKLLALIARL